MVGKKGTKSPKPTSLPRLPEEHTHTFISMHTYTYRYGHTHTVPAYATFQSQLLPKLACVIWVSEEVKSLTQLC